MVALIDTAVCGSKPFASHLALSLLWTLLVLPPETKFRVFLFFDFKKQSAVGNEVGSHLCLGVEWQKHTYACQHTRTQTDMSVGLFECHIFAMFGPDMVKITIRNVIFSK